jgi:hypothetical protein
VTEWDQAFAYAALELGVGVEVRARRGAERGPGTNLGNWLKLVFFKSATFVDEANAAEKLAEWLRDYNAHPQAEVGNKAPAILLAEERQRLRPLKVQPGDLALRVPVLVGPRASVVYDGQSYTMPPEAVGLIGVLRLYPDRVEIAAGRYETTHPRRRPSLSAYAPMPEVAGPVASDVADRPRPRPRTGSGPIPISPTITGSA